MFKTNYKEILKLIDSVQVRNYAKTRNFLDGEVSRLSPYITHGVLSIKEVAEFLINKFGLKGPGNAEHFIFQLGWREYFQKIWYKIGDSVFEPVKNPQLNFVSKQISEGLIKANTQIKVVDEAINELYKTGYMHNHARMWTASLVCNLNKTYFLKPAKWMFYYLLDGDVASNFLSWQWVAGTFSSKKYLCNQDNLNKYSKTLQISTPIDFSYEQLNDFIVNKEYRLDWGQRIELDLPVYLPKVEVSDLDLKKKKLCLYSIWSLDPKWMNNDLEVERVLLIEPAELEKLPMSKMRIDFILDLARNIPNLKIFVLDFKVFKNNFFRNFDSVVAKRHPAVKHWSGVSFDSPEFLFEGVNPPFKSYFDFWNKGKTILFSEYGKKNT